MANRFFLILSAACLFVFGSSPSAALILDANVLGIYTDSTFATPVAGLTIDPSGDVATAPLSTGDAILIGVEVSNPEADRITAIFTTLIYQGDELNYVGARLPTRMLNGPGHTDPSLQNVNSGDLKHSQPNNPGEPGDIWVQVLGYAAPQLPASGTGPHTIELLFEVSPAAIERDLVLFDMGLTAGDSVSGASSVTFSDAVIHVIPEPGTTLLIGLGLAALSRSGHRRRQM